MTKKRGIVCLVIGCVENKEEQQNPFFHLGQRPLGEKGLPLQHENDENTKYTII